MVGLVQDGDLDTVEAHDALLHEVFEAAGAGNDDVDAVAQRRSCGFWLTPPKTVRDGQAGGCGERLDRRGDLRRELTRRRQHQAAGAAGRAARREAPDRRATRGSANAIVLPLPVRPRPSTS